MYPSGELKRLADRKALLQARIAVRRWECAAAASEIARPLALIDRGLEIWRRIAPVVKILSVPLGLIATRAITRKRKGKVAGRSKLGMLMTMLPLIVRGIRFARQARAAHAAHRDRLRPAANPAPTARLR